MLMLWLSCIISLLVLVYVFEFVILPAVWKVHRLPFLEVPLFILWWDLFSVILFAKPVSVVWWPFLALLIHTNFSIFGWNFLVVVSLLPIVISSRTSITVTVTCVRLLSILILSCHLVK